MANDHRVPPILLDVAEHAATMIRRFYVAGGGSEKDLRTDLGDVVHAVLGHVREHPCLLVQAPLVIETATYKGPDRRGAGAWRRLAR